MLKFLLLTSFSILYTVAFCQNRIISGHVQDQLQNDIPCASIALHNHADSAMIKAERNRKTSSEEELKRI
jgi:hypothetical protein